MFIKQICWVYLPMFDHSFHSCHLRQMANRISTSNEFIIFIIVNLQSDVEINKSIVLCDISSIETSGIDLIIRFIYFTRVTSSSIEIFRYFLDRNAIDFIKIHRSMLHRFIILKNIEPDVLSSSLFILNYTHSIPFH